SRKIHKKPHVAETALGFAELIVSLLKCEINQYLEILIRRFPFLEIVSVYEPGCMVGIFYIRRLAQNIENKLLSWNLHWGALKFRGCGAPEFADLRISH